MPVADSMELELAPQNLGVAAADSTERVLQALEGVAAGSMDAVPNLAVAAGGTLHWNEYFILLNRH